MKLSRVVLDVTVDVDDDTDEAPLASLEPLVIRVGEVDRWRRGVGSSSAEVFPNNLGIFEEVALSSVTFFMLDLYNEFQLLFFAHSMDIYKQPPRKSGGRGMCH